MNDMITEDVRLALPYFKNDLPLTDPSRSKSKFRNGTRPTPFIEYVAPHQFPSSELRDTHANAPTVGHHAWESAIKGC